MELWMYGLGKDKSASAQKLKQLGFTTVAGSESCVEPAREAGLKAWLFTGTYRGPAFTGEEWMARDCEGAARDWFGSTCPTREEVRAYNLESIRKACRTPGIEGMIIDGCRFASPASGSVNDAFFTCFCPSCRKKARDMGFDPDAMLRSVQTLYDFCHGKEVDLLPEAEGLEEWLEFRRAATTEHLIHYTRAVHETNPDLKAGIFIFAPSLAKLVGQSYRDLAKDMDMFSPMLYRCYQDPRGAACLNAEMAVLLEILEGAGGLSAPQRIRVLRSLTGLPMADDTDKADLIRGFDTEVLRTETARARWMIPGKQLAPIIQLDDPELEKATRQTFAGGADAVSFFLYRDEWMEEKEEDFRKLQSPQPR